MIRKVWSEKIGLVSSNGKEKNAAGIRAQREGMLDVQHNCRKRRLEEPT